MKVIAALVTALSLLLGAYSILFDSHQDAFLEEENWMLAPFYRITDSYQYNYDFAEIRKNYSEELKVSDGKNAGKLYIFALDASGSMNQSFDKSKFFWYDNTVDELINDGYINDSWKIAGDQLTVYQVARVRLAELLSHRSSFDLNESDKFAIWTIGDTADKIFPNHTQDNDKYSVMKRSYAIRSLKELESISNADVKSEGNTDFVDFLQEIKKEYKDYFERPSDGVHEPVVILTIISDMLHDVNYNGMALWENWDALEQYIMDISNENIMANLILASGKRELQNTVVNEHYQIVPTFEKELSWHRLSRRDIIERAKKIYTPVTVKKPLIIYYEHEKTGALAPIELVMDRDDDISISIPEEVNYKEQNLQYKIKLLGAGNTPRKERTITSRKGAFRLPAKTSQTVEIDFEGGIPNDQDFNYLIIQSEFDQKFYLFDVEFKRILPEWVSWFFLFLQIVILTMILYLFYRIFCLLFSIIFRKIKGNNKNKAIKIKSPARNINEYSIMSPKLAHLPDRSIEGGASIILGEWFSRKNTLEFFESGHVYIKFYKKTSDAYSGQYIVYSNDIIEFFGVIGFPNGKVNFSLCKVTETLKFYIHDEEVSYRRLN